jgi:dimethylhistidine N-methyltransferase
LNRSAAFSFHDRLPDTGSFLDDVIAGLSLPRKSLSPKYFYDKRGCELFEAICRTPEYYPTRAETALMQQEATVMARRLGPRCAVIEHGCGSGRKTRILLDALKPVAYVPIDIARDQLRAMAGEIAREYPGLAVMAICADYSRPLALPEIDELDAQRRIVFFPGSTIGNLTPAEAAGFLGNVRDLVGPGGGMLIGVDLRKDAARLNAAYNDRRGITAKFNLNLLARINRELGADFDLAAFRHQAFYNEPAGRIEMHLLSIKSQQVRVGGREIRIRAGETIHTENSYKYSVTGFQTLARGAGFDPVECWTDAARLFAVHYLDVPR